MSRPAQPRKEKEEAGLRAEFARTLLKYSRILVDRDGTPSPELLDELVAIAADHHAPTGRPRTKTQRAGAR